MAVREQKHKKLIYAKLLVKRAIIFKGDSDYLTMFQGINFIILQMAVKFWISSWAGLARGKVQRQNIDSHRNFLYSAQIPHCHSPILVLRIQSKTWSSFLSVFLNWRKNSNFFKLTVLRSDFMKQNYGRFIFKTPQYLQFFTLANGFQLSLFILTEISGFEIQICGGGATWGLFRTLHMVVNQEQNLLESRQNQFERRLFGPINKILLLPPSHNGPNYLKPARNRFTFLYLMRFLSNIKYFRFR